ncbi:MAG: hypothetical protein IJ618_08875 [Prevotella sp.]|nr:hypothetical protein [Prevotella sp.]
MNTQTTINRTLLRAANSIIANIANTENIGLNNGKMAICLFFHKYYLITGAKTYEDIAYILMDEIIKQLSSEKMALSISQMSEVGVGLLELFDSGFFETSDISGIVKNIDHLVLKHPYFLQSSDRKRCQQDIFFQGIYVLKRLLLEQFALHSDTLCLFATKIYEYINLQDETLINRRDLYWLVLKFVFKELMNKSTENQLFQILAKSGDNMFEKIHVEDGIIFKEERLLPYLLCQVLLPKLCLRDLLTEGEICQRIDKEIQNLYYNKYTANVSISILSLYLIFKS